MTLGPWPASGRGEAAVQLRQLEHFEAVYRLRSFTRAARELYLSQSALSRSIQALEADLGQPLFDRSTHAVEPTDAAEALIGHAVDAVSSARTLIDSARLLRDGEGGSVAVGTGPYPARPLMTRAVRKLSTEHPGLQVSVVGGAASDLLAALVRRDLDFVVCDVSKAEESSFAAEIDTEPLPTEPLALVVGADHPLAAVAEPTPAQVIGHPFVLPPPAPVGRRVLTRSLDPASRSTRVPFYEVESTAACLEVVADQRSVTLVPVSLARQECSMRGLVFRTAAPGQATHDGIHVLRGRTAGASARIARDAVLAQASVIAEEDRSWQRIAGTGWQR